jgi:methyl-accepting chemotaxis protein
MAEASGRITEANANLEQMLSSIREINASSDKISKIIQVIDEIAFQTNIMACTDYHCAGSDHRTA